MHKRIICFVVLWLLPLLLLAEANNISISGQVLNAKARQIKIVLYSFVPGEEDHASSTELDKNNNFQFVAYIREPMLGRVFYNKQSAVVYVQPGAQVQLSFDASDFNKTLTFKGEGASENYFLSQHYFKFEQEGAVQREKAKKKSPAEFMAWAQKRLQDQLDFLAAHKDLNPAFVSYQKYNYEYQWANELFAYAQERQTAKGKKNKLPENYYSFIDEVKLHNYEVISLESYRNFLSHYLKYHYTKTYKTDPAQDKEYYNRMYEIAADNLRSLPKFHMQAVYLVEAISQLGMDTVKDEYIEFANECPLQPYKNELHELVKMQNVFEVSKPKVVFKGKDGKEVPLSELKGNIVLVRFDNNITTTAPEELKKRDEQLKKELAVYKDVKFLQLSMLENRDAYERMVYADANDYLKSIINRPKPGQQVSLPPWSYVVLNREGLVVSNSLDDPNNELAIEKIKVILQQEDQQAAAEQP